jgi:gas vesicle protein
MFSDLLFSANGKPVNGNELRGGCMAYEYDRYEREEGGGSFLMGLLAGTVLGAGLGMLFAPKAGSELRNQLGESAGKLRSTAGDTYQQASDKVSQMVDRGRDAYDRARSTVSNVAGGATGTTGTTGVSGSTGSTPASNSPGGSTAAPRNRDTGSTSTQGGSH